MPTLPSGGGERYRIPSSLLPLFCDLAVFRISSFLVLVTSLSGLANAQYAPGYGAPRVQQQRGATVGGIAGAVIGGLIGDHNNEAGAGAAIGGVVGAVAGGVLGNAADKERAAVAQQRAAIAAQQQTLATAPQPLPQGVVTMADVATMSRSGLSDSIILSQIQNRGIDRQLAVSDIITLHQQGVSETVITAMQNARVGASVPLAGAAYAKPPVVLEPVAPAPVVVERHYVVPRYVPPRVHHYHVTRPRGTHLHFGF